MSKTDEIFKQNCREIPENGVSDADMNVRPRWEDGTPAPIMRVEDITDFYKFTRYSFTAENYRYHEFDEKIPVAI